MQYEELAEWFTRYVTPFKENEQNIFMTRKEEHTHRVVENAKQLCDALDWNEEDTTLAMIIALLHDIGRFPQLETYGTFRDDLSEDHAATALTIIDEQRLLADWPVDQQQIIKTAVYWHNKPDSHIPKSLDVRADKHVKLIRDADKIDIIKVIEETRTRKEREDLAKAGSITLEHTINENIKQHVMNDEDIKKADVTTFAENNVFFLNWIHQLIFPASIALLKAQGHYDAMLTSIPRAHDDIKQHLERAYKNRLISAS